jgi:molybdopterin converting factor small subunit
MMETMIKIKIFGQLEDITQANEVTVETVTDTEELLQLLFENYAGLKEKKFKIAVNKKITEEKTMLKATDEIALLPPFSGG